MASKASSRTDTRKVVIVEDDYDLRAILKRALEADGCEVMAFGEGESIISLLDTLDDILRDALFVLDLKMPRASGVEVCAAVRARLDPNTPVLVVTGVRDSSVCRRLLEEGADDYVVKPVAMDAFLERVHRLQRLADAGRLAEARRDTQRRIAER